MSHRAVDDDGMTYLELSHVRRFLLGASYGGGLGGAWPVGADGTLTELESVGVGAGANWVRVV